jgi:hypothetical protein
MLLQLLLLPLVVFNVVPFIFVFLASLHLLGVLLIVVFLVFTLSVIPFVLLFLELEAIRCALLLVHPLSPAL